MPMRFRILNVEPDRYAPQARKILNSIADLDEVRLTREDLVHRIRDYDVLITRLGFRIDAEVINAGPRLKVIATATTGLDHVDLAAARRQGIQVISLNGEVEFLRNVTATAELTWGLLLSLVRHIPSAHRSVLASHWTRDVFWGVQLSGKRLGIVGLGRVGRQVAQYALAFGMLISAYTKGPQSSMPGVQSTNSLSELLAASDVITLHVPLMPETTNMIGAAEFARMPRGGLLINTSRGSIIDEDALLNALSSGHLGGAALDVLRDEGNFPSSSASGLMAYATKHDNLILTPHIGGATVDSLEKVEVFVAQKMHAYLSSLRQG